jgi:hypothetical protein
MTVNKALLAAAMLCLILPAAPALAHDDTGYAYPGEHWRLHEQLSDAHRRAHEEGFESREEHRAYHRALRDMHEDFHDDHPGVRSYWRPYYWGAWGSRY